MPVSVAYLAVVLIWSTTPLGIVFSSESISPTLAVLMRMVIALVLGFTIIIFMRIKLPWHKQALRLYSYSSIGIVGGMLLSYFAARTVSSGMMSLLFGLSPILSGLFAQKILGEAKFSHVKKMALFIALSGLLIVCSGNVSFENGSWIGIILLLIAVSFFSLSGVMVKTIHICIHPMATTVGALTFSTPVFILAWFLADGSLPIEQWQAKSWWAVLYLGLFGSLIGFIAYFYILQNLSATTVTLVTLITPPIAIMLGAQLNNEVLNSSLIYGALCILLGLSLFQFGESLKLKLFNKKLN